MSDSDTTTADTADTTTDTAVVDAPKVETFKMGANEVPFQRLKSAFDSGDKAGFNTILGAIEMMYGKDAEVIEAGFHTTLKAHHARLEIEKYEKELSGYTAGASLIKLLKSGIDIATEAGGNVTFTISIVKGEGEDSEDKAVLKSAFRGIQGVGSKRGGGSGSKGRYQYFDSGTLIETSLKKYLLETHPASKATTIINEYAAKPNSNISAWDAAQRGMKDGDGFVITRGEKKAVESPAS